MRHEVMALGPVSSYPPSQDLVDGSTLFQGALSDDFRPHFFHIQHESIQGLLNSGLLGFLLSLWFWLRFPWWDKRRGCQHQSHQKTRPQNNPTARAGVEDPRSAPQMHSSVFIHPPPLGVINELGVEVLMP